MYIFVNCRNVDCQHLFCQLGLRFHNEIELNDITFKLYCNVFKLYHNTQNTSLYLKNLLKSTQTGVEDKTNTLMLIL